MSKTPLSPGNKGYLKALGRTVRNFRREMGLYQEQLAARVGIAPTRIGEIERGKVDTSITRIRLVALGMGTPMSTLLRRIELEKLDPVGLDVLRERAIKAIKQLHVADLDLLLYFLGRLIRTAPGTADEPAK